MDFIMMGRFQMRSSSTPWKPQWTSLVPRDRQIAGNSPTTVSCCRPISTPWALPDHPPPTFPRVGPAPKISGSSLLTSSTPKGVRAVPLTCDLWFEIFANSTSQSHQDSEIFSLGTFHYTHTDPRSCSKSLIWSFVCSPDSERCEWISIRSNSKKHTSHCFANFLGRKWVVGLIFIPCLPM